MERVLVVLTSFAIISGAEAFSLCVERADYPPLLFAQDINGRAGLLPDMVRAAAAEQGESVELLRHPWKRCIDMLKKGQVDAIAASFWSPERDAWGAFPKKTDSPLSGPDNNLRLWREEYRIFVPQGSELRYDGTHFSGLNTGLGAPPGYVVWQRLKDSGVLTDQVLQPKTGLRLVALQRLDGYVSERSIGRNLLRELGLEGQVTLLPQTYYEDDSYLVFSHQFRQRYPQLTQAVWHSLPATRTQYLKALELD
jgi:polar amino acid transport system substrate-binding protein